MTKEFQSVLSQQEGLKTLLQNLKPDSKLDEFQNETIKLLRIAMPDGTVTWGGQKKPTMESIVMEKMTKREAAEITSPKGSGQWQDGVNHEKTHEQNP